MFSIQERQKPEDHPNFINKGKKGLRCNRTACPNTEAYWYNRVTEAYYCQPCANRINESALHSGGDCIVFLSEEDKKDWKADRIARVEGRKNG